MNITVTVNDAEVKALLDRLQKQTGNLGPAMRKIGLWYERRVVENFEREQAPDGTPWPRLSATTLMMGLGRKGRSSKRDKGLTTKGRAYLQGKKMLVDSGRLKSRVHHQADANSVTIGVAGIEYAAIHQFGGMAGRGRKVKIPARPYLAMNRGTTMVLAERDKAMVVGILKEHIAKAIPGRP
jgi:phage virion morphogenesis protein